MFLFDLDQRKHGVGIGTAMTESERGGSGCLTVRYE
jgi:hypothetical protein